ncbi:sulfotransferase domain-containing protein [uncultured Jatrophihabitans sp.]|uniref:sulfotransferase domain-containing protein n=1 Tax=uncultured Jatrophihabitans sp. TaxID=1610747 RepID=UPI0035CB06C8
MKGNDRVQPGQNPHRLISLGRSAVRKYGSLTAPWRPLPEFLIIGAKRGGSTSFYYDLLGHPQIASLFPRPDHLPKASATKGVHYFDQNYDRGPQWYRGHLPSMAARALQSHRHEGPVITGEASPYYLFHPAAAERAAALVPQAKIIAVLRDPVDRTYSHWKERRRAQAEDLDFASALDVEDARIGDVEMRLRADPAFHSYAHEHQSYARQSEYAPALQRWYDNFPRDRILILSSDEYYFAPQQVLEVALAFLDLPAHPLATGKIRNAAEGGNVDADLRVRLTARFAPHNANLEQLVGRRFSWS